MSIVFTILKHIWPTVWFKAMAKEAEQIPATVVGIFTLSGALIVLSSIALMQYKQDAKADEVRFNSMQTTISKNTTALDCARKDRIISAKTREIGNLQRLLDRAADDAEKRELTNQLAELQRELNKAESGYDNQCLSKA